MNHIKCQALYSLKNNYKNIRMSSATVLLGALRFKYLSYLCLLFLKLFNLDFLAKSTLLRSC